MKKVEDIIFDELKSTTIDREYWYEGEITHAIKVAQLNAIEETVKLCAEKAKAELDYIIHENEYIGVFNKDSILNCIELLKKELWKKYQNEF